MIWSIASQVLLGVGVVANFSPTVSRIIKRAEADGIDLKSQPWASAAFGAINELQRMPLCEHSTSGTPKNIDTHAHVVPAFYYDIMPVRPDMNWTVQRQLQHMANLRISHTILSVPWPGASVYRGNKPATLALARILNEYLAQVVRQCPTHFSFFAVAPLPYTEPALLEVRYSFAGLRASGIGLFSNHEGRYLGNSNFRSFFSGVNELKSTHAKVIFIHPAIPTCIADVHSASNVEFYFDTANTMMDMTLTNTFHDFTSLRYIISHGGGAFPSILDRMFVHESPDFKARSEEIFKTRIWWDSAGATYPRQIQGLLAYNIPKSQLVYGTDFPFSVGPYDQAALAVANAPFLTTLEKAGVFRSNALVLFPSAGN